MSGFVLQSIGVTDDPGFVLESIEASSAIAVLHDLDAGNINPTLTVISDAETATPSIELTPRAAPSPLGNGHVHWLFALSGAAGKQPTITVSNAARYSQTTMASSWRPVYSYDLETWHQATAFTPLTSPTRVQFQFPTAFTSDTVYIADHPVFQAAHFDALAAEMAADPTGLVHLSSAATSGGVIGTTPAENDDIGRAVGGNSMYGFRLEDESATTTDGKPRRELVVTCGIHSGEVIDGWYLRGLVDYYINDMSATGVAFLRNWRVLTYFALTPNGRKGGHWRCNWRSTEDPNRDWASPGAFSLFETATVRDAILADVSRRDVHLDFHSNSGSNVVPRIYYRTDLPFERYSAFKTAFDARDVDVLSMTASFAGQTIGEWSAANGAKLVITSEPGTRTSATVERYGQIATNYVGALADMDAAGWFGEAPAGTLTLGTPSVTSYSISIPWTYSASDHTGVEYRYRLTAGTWSAWADGGRVSPIEIAGLTSSAEYEVEARSYNVLGTGAPQTVTVTVGVSVAIAPATGHISAQGYAPAIQQPRTVAPQTGQISARGYAPEIGQAASIRPETGHIQATGYAPTVQQGDAQAIAPQTGHAKLSGHAPIIVQGLPIVIAPQTGHIVAQGHAPSINQPRTIAPQTGRAQLSGYAPGVVQGGAVTVNPQTGHVRWRGWVPTVTPDAELPLPSVALGARVQATSLSARLQ